MSMNMETFRLKYFLKNPIYIENSKIYKGEELNLPLNINIHYMYINDSVSFPTKETGYIQLDKKNYYINILRYIGGVGNYKDYSHKGKKYVEDLIHEYPEYNIIRNADKVIKISNQTRIIHNYGVLNATYDYRNEALSEYYKWYNQLNTLISNVNDLSKTTNRDIFIHIEIPEFHIQKSVFIKHLRKITHETIRDLKNFKSFTILDLIRFFNKTTYSKSLFYKLNQETLNRINLVFHYVGYVSFINLGDLVERLDTYGGRSSSKNFIDDFIIFINKFILEVERLRSRSVVSKIIDDNDEPDEVKLDISDIEELNNITDEEDGDVEYKYMRDYNDLDDVMNKDISVYDDLLNRLEFRYKNKLITTAQYKSLKESLKKQKNSMSPYGDGKLVDMMQVSQEEVDVDYTKIKLPDANVVMDKGDLSSAMQYVDEVYNTKIIKKDLLSVIYSIQKSDIIVQSHKIEEHKDILSHYEMY